MSFGEQLKKIRKENKLTQEQMATQLHISRQAVSNWENNKNLPDIEMTIKIAKVLQVSPDQLILGDEIESRLVQGEEQGEKEINIPHEKMKKPRIFFLFIGTVLFIMGGECIFIKANSVEYVDSTGVLHENFFLLPVGFLFIFLGLVIFLVGFVPMVKKYISRQKERQEKEGEEGTPQKP